MGTADVSRVNDVDSSKPKALGIEKNIKSAIIVRGLEPITDKHFGFVERIVDHEQQKCIFYVAGITEFGTAGAAYYLVNHWRELYEQYGDKKSFLKVLRLSPDNYKNAQVIF
jgi:hypothetical protein